MPSSASGSGDHVLADRDPSECYKVMMSERTELIKARREAEDGAIRTKTQISSAILAVLAAYSLQDRSQVDIHQAAVLACSALLLVASILFGIMEQRSASKAYLQQEKNLIDFYTMVSNTYADAAANVQVRLYQKWCMISFVSAMFGLALLIIVNVGLSYVRQA